VCHLIQYSSIYIQTYLSCARFGAIRVCGCRLVCYLHHAHAPTHGSETQSLLVLHFLFETSWTVFPVNVTISSKGVAGFGAGAHGDDDEDGCGANNKRRKSRRNYGNHRLWICHVSYNHWPTPGTIAYSMMIGVYDLVPFSFACTWVCCSCFATANCCADRHGARLGLCSLRWLGTICHGMLHCLAPWRSISFRLAMGVTVVFLTRS